MKKIAFSGMKGRKKDTFLLASVIFLAFVFVITAIVFYGSSEKTKIEQRKQAFGQWENAYFSGQEDIENRLEALEEVESIGKSIILARSNEVGLVGSIDEKLMELGNFQFQSGGFPKNSDEIAIELNQLSNFSEDIKVGDKISLEMEVILLELPEDHEDLQAPSEERNRIIMENLKYLTTDSESKYFEIFKETDIENVETFGDFFQLEGVFENVLYDVYFEASGYASLGKNTRNTQDIQYFDGIKVEVRKDYEYWFLGDEEEGSTSIENIEEKGVLKKERIILTKEMTVSGILNTYSDRWDIENYSVANSFISEDSATSFIEGAIYKTKNAQVDLYKASSNFFLTSTNKSEEFFQEHKEDFTNLKRNTYSFPISSGSVDNILAYGILAFIFIATIFSVFQIYLTQMKRRTRKLALIKAIGGTNKQVRQVLLWEVLILLAIIIPLSIFLGLGLARLIIFIMNNFRGSQTVFYIDIKLVVLGLLVGIVSVFLGMVLPMVKSMKVPLRGDISGAPKRKKKSTREILKLDKDQKIKRQNFSQITKRHNQYNRGKNTLTLGLYAITITVLLASIFSGFLSFGEYIDMVIAPNKADYQLKTIYGMRTAEIDEMVMEIRDLNGIESVSGYKYGEAAFFWYEGIDENPIFNSYKELLPTNLIYDSFGGMINDDEEIDAPEEEDEGTEEESGPLVMTTEGLIEDSLVKDNDFVNLTDNNRHLVKDAIKASTYASDLGTWEYDNFIKAITKGQIDEKAYENGDEVIVLMPMYLKGQESKIEIDKSIIENTTVQNRMARLLSASNAYDLTYDFRDSGYYNRNNHLKVGDDLHLTVPTENIKGEYATNDVRFIETKVGGIVNYFPEKGIWPFSATIENPVVVGSSKFLHEMYPNSRSGIRNMSKDQYERMRARLRPTAFGNTLINISTNSDFDDVKDFIDLQRIGKDGEMSLEVLRESNNILKDKALKSSIIIGVLGISIAFLTLIILYNTALSNIEQERERIGILQALGVEGARFKISYFKQGLAYGLLSIAIAHILLTLALVIASIIEVGSITLFLQGNYLSILKNKLWLYPWKLHIGTSLVFLIWTVITYYTPIRKIVENQAVDNIRSLTR